MPSFVRPRPVAWFFFLLGFTTCVGLGTWQVQRLAWKEGVIAALATANAQAPLTALPKDEAELAALQFRRITLSGTWRDDVEFHIAPRYFKGKFGYWIITPLKLADGRIVLVNRGWVPGAKKLVETRPGSSVKGRATIDGIVRIGPERSYFTPVSQPEKNIWFGRDIADIAAFTKLDNVIPAMVDVVEKEQNPTADGRLLEPVSKLPIASDGTIRLRNDHLSYVLTWYSIALGILVNFLVYHRKKA
jgi:surfeit locus 1 family protein